MSEEGRNVSHFSLKVCLFRLSFRTLCPCPLLVYLLPQKENKNEKLTPDHRCLLYFLPHKLSRHQLQTCRKFLNSQDLFSRSFVNMLGSAIASSSIACKRAESKTKTCLNYANRQMANYLFHYDMDIHKDHKYLGDGLVLLRKSANDELRRQLLHCKNIMGGTNSAMKFEIVVRVKYESSLLTRRSKRRAT